MWDMCKPPFKPLSGIDHAVDRGKPKNANVFRPSTNRKALELKTDAPVGLTSKYGLWSWWNRCHFSEWFLMNCAPGHYSLGWMVIHSSTGPISKLQKGISYPCGQILHFQNMCVTYVLYLKGVTNEGPTRTLAESLCTQAYSLVHHLCIRFVISAFQQCQTCQFHPWKPT